MSTAQHQQPYIEQENVQERLMLAVKAIEAISQIPGPLNLKTELRKRIFREVVWMLTEHAGKYSTRYRSKLALQAKKSDVQHEHVFPISHLYYLSRHGLSLKEVLSLCSGCVVTKEEHKRLSAQDRLSDAPFGWKRYQRAGIEVIDLLESHPITPAEIEAWTLPFENAMRDARFCGDGEIDLEMERAEKKTKMI